MQTSTQQPGAASATDTRKCIKRMRARLERWELPHLRELAARLAEELEAAEQRAAYAEDAASMWQQHAADLEEELPRVKPGIRIGLSADGALHVLQGGAA